MPQLRSMVRPISRHPTQPRRDSSQLPTFLLPPAHSPKEFQAGQMEKLLVSPSGRYALCFEQDVLERRSDEEKSTHYNRPIFSLVDLFNRQWSAYTSNLGPLHTTRLYYWLTDEIIVLVTYSRYFAKLEQHLCFFDHKEKIVENPLARRYDWEVDEVISPFRTNVTPLSVLGRDYLPVYGGRDGQSEMLLLLIPYNLSPSEPSLPEIQIPEYAIIRHFVTIYPESNPTGYPLTHGSKILLRYTGHFPRQEAANSFIAFDVEKFLYEEKTDYLRPSSSSLQMMRIPDMISPPFRDTGHPCLMSSSNPMDNAPGRLVYYNRFTSRCLVVDLEQNRCCWVSPASGTNSQCYGLILLHPTGLLLHVEVPRKNEEETLLVRSLGRLQTRVPSLEKLALAAAITRRAPIDCSFFPTRFWQ